MKDNNINTDIMAEELLTAYGKELRKSQEQYLNKLEDDAQPDPPIFSDPPRAKVHVRRRLRRVLIIVAVLVLAMAVALVASSGLREKMLGYFMTDHQGYTDLSSLKNSPKGEMPKFKMAYVPNGYKKTSSDSDSDSFDLSYSNGKGNDAKYLNFSVFKHGKMSVDNDTLKRKSTTVNGYQAFIFYDNKNTGIIWQVGDYTFNLWTQLPQNETVKIAQNIGLADQ